MRYLHTMVRVRDSGQRLQFNFGALDQKEIRRFEIETGRFTLTYLELPRKAAALQDREPRASTSNTSAW